MNEDFIARMLCDDLNVRACAAITLGISNGLARMHGATPAAALALSRTATAAALMSATLKPGSDQTVSVRISGTGPIREIHVQADAKGHLRGYAGNPGAHSDLSVSGLSISGLIGAGTLTVIKDLGLKEPYSSVQPLVRGEVAHDIAHYLTFSEQVPSALIIGTALEPDGAFSASGGILIQGLPGTAPEALVTIEENIGAMKTSLGERLRQGADIYTVTGELLGDRALELLESSKLELACRCNRELLARIIVGLPAHEIEDLLRRDRGIELTCTFCTTRYRFDEREVRTLMSAGNRVP
ncbi:MAG: Hsp33 family molecular chaperone HslO [Spirochaetes bacterium]|nr:MAG: Hsp33 family molecular chaperone HslO [Spirochaetota bacterium]